DLVEDGPPNLLDQLLPAVGLGLVLFFVDGHPLRQPLAGLHRRGALIESQQALAGAPFADELGVLEVGLERLRDGVDRGFNRRREAIHADLHRSLMLRARCRSWALSTSAATD